MRLDCDFHQEEQASQWWPHTLPNGQQAQVFLVADQQALAQAVSRLSFQGPRSLTALDIQGVNLRAAAGRLCLLQVAFWDGGGLQCFLFDIMQLGEHVGALSPFLQNTYTPKFIHNAQLAATVLAHKFGITLSGVIDVGTAFQMLHEGQPLTSLMDYFEWCNVAVPGQRQEWGRMDKTPELWAHRPLARPTLSYAVQGICTLHATYPLLSSRLCSGFGPSAIEMLANMSHQLVQVHATGGWACRKQGLWIGEQSAQKNPDDADLDDWLTKRFGKKAAGAQNRRSSPEKSIRATKATELPVTAVRASDSPRTASWRAAVAEIEAPEVVQSRQRSGSPTLESWLARRTQVKSSDPEQKSKRASSVPAPRSAAQNQKAAEDASHPRWAAQSPFGIGMPNGMRDWSVDPNDRRPWAEIIDADDREVKEDEEDIFGQLQEQERQRLAQAENA